jgi:hypothetical protein
MAVHVIETKWAVPPAVSSWAPDPKQSYRHPRLGERPHTFDRRLREIEGKPQALTLPADGIVVAESELRDPTPSSGSRDGRVFDVDWFVR